MDDQPSDNAASDAIRKATDFCNDHAGELVVGGVGLVDAGRYTIVICDREDDGGDYVARSAQAFQGTAINAQRRSA